MRTALVPLAYVALCVGMWTVPLFGILHAESSALVAGVAFVVAGLAAVRAFRNGASFGRVLRGHMALLVIPWALLTVTLFWLPNRGYGQGLLLYAAFAPPSVALAAGLAYALTGRGQRFPYLSFLGVAGAVLLFTPLYDLGLHPQFYHYNHVFGGVLGPIYDEELALRPGLFAFRGLTLLWACAAFLFGEMQRGHAVRQRLFATLSLIGLTYALGGWLGLNTPAWRLRQTLPGHVRTAHFDLHFDPGAVSAGEIARIAREHEWRYVQLRDTLGIDVRGRISSFLYPDARTRARLTGAAYTSVAPVWLPMPQMHLLQHRLDDVLGHELVHVFSRGFGLPFVRASRQVGLVEGLAVALEPPDGLPTPHEQVISAALSTSDTLLARRVAASLGAGGFWTGRGAVSYTTMGSFVRYLFDTYGAARLRDVYAWGDFERVYGKSVEVLAVEWEEALHRLDYVGRAAAPLARQRFSVPSIFERENPHWVPPEVRLTRRAAYRLGWSDTLRALSALEAALRHAPTYAPALDQWAQVRIERGEVARVLERLDTLHLANPALRVRRADARALLGYENDAVRDYEAARDALPAYAHAAAIALGLRAALAAHPEAIAVRYGRAGADTTAAGAVLEALRLRDTQPAEAYRLLGSADVPVMLWPSPGARNRYRAQHEGWLAEAALAAGWFGRAERHACAAATRFKAVGDRNAARYWYDVAAQARWAQRTPSIVP